jgi:hypothetical protein
VMEVMHRCHFGGSCGRASELRLNTGAPASTKSSFAILPQRNKITNRRERKERREVAAKYMHAEQHGRQPSMEDSGWTRV